MKKIFIAVLALAGLTAPALQAQAGLSDNERETLIYLVEEEKLARDFYELMEGKWGAKIFNNIAEAEQRHLDKATDLAARHGVKLPRAVTADKPGKFQDKRLQQFYDELLASGGQSMEAALRAGAHIEEADIRDLKQALETAQDESLRNVYGHLLDASGNHLRAFHKKLTAQGVAYRPVVLPEADFDAIIGAGGQAQGCQGQKAQSGRQGKGCCQSKGAKKGQCCQGAGKGNGQGKGKGKAGATGL